MVGVNGSGKHTNVSVSKNDKNLFTDRKAKRSSASLVMSSGPHSDSESDICLLRSSVSTCRRLDPHFGSAESDQGIGSRSRLDDPHSDRQPTQHARQFARWLRMRSVFSYAVDFQSGLEADRKDREPAPGGHLPDKHLRCSENFRNADWFGPYGQGCQGRYADLKQASADRCPRLLGTFVKAPEVQYHHDVYNQYLWNLF